MVSGWDHVPILFAPGYPAFMPKRTAPDPSMSIAAARAAGRQAALLFAKGIGERMILREAAAIFDSLCPGLSQRVAKRGRELAMAEAQARKEKPLSDGVPSQEPSLLSPTTPKDERDAVRDSRDAGSESEQASGSRGQPLGESQTRSHGAGCARGGLRLIIGGRLREGT